MTVIEDVNNVGPAINAESREEFAAIVKKFDSPFIKIPFEQFRRAYRQEMRIAEKDLSALEALVNKHLGKGEVVPENVTKALTERVNALQKKFSEYKTDCQKFRERFLKRLKWIEDCCERGNYRSWSRSRLLRLVCDFLIRAGDLKSVKTMISESINKSQSLEDLIDTEFAETQDCIVSALEAGRLEEALAWCSDHRPNLKKINSNLELSLKQQEFIELLKADKVAEAMKCAQKNFGSWTETNYAQVKECMALLCWFPFLGKGIKWNNGLMQKYELMISPISWTNIIEQFKKDLLVVYGINEQPQLLKIVRSGLSALKTRQCSCKESEPFSECPVCVGPLSQIASTLPYGHFEISRIRCRMTGLFMNEDNPAMVLPNGQVISAAAVSKLAAESRDNNFITCPFTGQTFCTNELRKCFIL
jgi:macrophage erythroblast attacher